MKFVSNFRQFNWVIFGVYLTLSAVSLLTLYSLGQTREDAAVFFKKQLLFFGLGLALIFILWRSDYRVLRSAKRLSFLIYVLAMVGLLVVLFSGITVKGSQSWFRFGIFGFQPIEFAKIATLLVLAKYLSIKHIEIKRLSPILTSGLYVALPVALVLLQPDFGSAVMMIVLWVGMILMAGLNLRQLAVIFGMGLLIFTLSWLFLFEDYQKDRILSFLNPERDLQGAAYNRNQSIIAIGSGGLLGQGLGQGTQARFGFLPEALTDFMFASVGEEWGWLGVVVVMAAFVILSWELNRVARAAPNNFAKLFIGGLMILLLAQVGTNSLMNLGLLPIVGIPMPFLSYGGSNFLFTAAALGLAQSIHRLNSFGV